MQTKDKVSFISFVLNFSVEYLPSVLQSCQEVIVGRLDGRERISSRGKENSYCVDARRTAKQTIVPVEGVT